MADTLARVAKAETDCIEANVEENDYTVFTWQDLEFELELVTQAIAKKISFIDNQARISLRIVNHADACDRSCRGT